MAELLKFIQTRLANPADDEAEEGPLLTDLSATTRDDSPQLVQHPHITNLQQWLDLNA